MLHIQIKTFCGSVPLKKANSKGDELSFETKADWKIRPKMGLGRLKFGMTKSEVNSLSSIYGEIESERLMEMSESVIDSTLAMFGDTVSSADKQAFMQGIRDTYTGSLVQVRKAQKAHLILEFDQSGLVQIQIGQNSVLLHLGNLSIFQSSVEAVLAELEHLNGRPGRFRRAEVVFDELAISLDCFCELTASGAVEMIPEHDVRFAGRSITLRRNAYIPEYEMHEFVGFSFR